jgi:hypothetical protein
MKMNNENENENEKENENENENENEKTDVFDRYKEPTYKKFIVWFDKTAKAPPKDPSLVLADEYYASLAAGSSSPSPVPTPAESPKK